MKAMESFLPSDTGARKTLADMIFEKFESGDIEPGKTVKVVDKEEGQYSRVNSYRSRH